MKWLLTIPCWGDFYVETFQNFVLPSLRAAMAALPSADFRVIIHTNQPFDVGRLNVEFRPILGTGDYGDFGAAHREAIELAEDGERIAFLCADMPVSRECFLVSELHFAVGKQFVMCAAGRCRYEDAGTLTSGMSGRGLLDWSVKHPHHSTLDCYFGAGRMAVPWGLYFGDDNNVILRPFHLHPFASMKGPWLSFQGVTIDQDIIDHIPQDKVGVITNDQMALVELSPDWRVFALRRQPITAEQVAVWAVNKFSYANRWLFRHRVIIKGDGSYTGDVDVCNNILNEVEQVAA